MTVDYLLWDGMRHAQGTPPQLAWWTAPDGVTHGVLPDGWTACGATRRTLEWQPGGTRCGVCAWLDARGWFG